MKGVFLLLLLIFFPGLLKGQQTYFLDAGDTSCVHFLFDTTMVFYDSDGNELPVTSSIVKDTLSLTAFGPESKVVIKGLHKKPGTYIIYAGKISKDTDILLVFEIDSALRIKILSHRQYFDYNVTKVSNISFTDGR